MSIRDLIRECRDAGELVRLTPSLQGSVHMREVFATHHVARFLRAERDTPRSLLMKAVDTRVAIDRFMAGAMIAVALDPDKKGAMAELARNREIGDGVWNFRIRDPKPHVRLFGGFAERDHFVAIDYRDRTDLDFDAAVKATLTTWRELFGDCAPLIGDEIGTYLSDRYRLV